MNSLEPEVGQGGAAGLVSVIVPCYGQGKYLTEAVESLTQQDYARWECIIVDDGSPDNTREVASALVRGDSRVRYVEQPHRGAASARNHGLMEARGEYIQFLDADDLFLPTKLTAAIALAREAADPSIVISDYWLMDEAGRRFENETCIPEFQLREPVHDLALRWETGLSIASNAMLFDARLFRDHGIRFSETLRNHEDWDCWMRIFMLRPRICRLRQKHSVYRIHGDSLSRDEEENWRGFRQAIGMQIELWAGDAELRRMLVYKRKLNDDLYGKTLRIRALGKLRRSPWFNKAVPQSLRRSVLRRLDLSDLDAHGWLR